MTKSELFTKVNTFRNQHPNCIYKCEFASIEELLPENLIFGIAKPTIRVGRTYKVTYMVILPSTPKLFGGAEVATITGDIYMFSDKDGSQLLEKLISMKFLEPTDCVVVHITEPGIPGSQLFLMQSMSKPIRDKNQLKLSL